ncbi:MAG: type II secretion system protein [Phycisphaerales bacterium]
MQAHRATHPTPRSRARRRVSPLLRGFSLLEAVICVTVIGILSAVAVVRFAGANSRSRATAAGSALAAAIGRVREESDAASASRQMTFVKGASEVPVTDERGRAIRVERLGFEPGSCVIWAADLGGDTVLQFNGFGVPAAGGTVTVFASGTLCTVTIASGDARCEVGPPRDPVDRGGR